MLDILAVAASVACMSSFISSSSALPTPLLQTRTQTQLQAPRQPVHSWHTVPVFAETSNVTGPFDQKALETLAKFPIFIAEKAYNYPAPGFAEDKLGVLSKQLRALAPNITLVFYYNANLDLTDYRLYNITACVFVFDLDFNHFFVFSCIEEGANSSNTDLVIRVTTLFVRDTFALAISIYLNRTGTLLYKRHKSMPMPMPMPMPPMLLSYAGSTAPRASSTMTKVC